MTNSLSKPIKDTDNQYVITTKEKAEQLENLLHKKISDNPKLQQSINQHNEMMKSDSEAVKSLREFDLF